MGNDSRSAIMSFHNLFGSIGLVKFAVPHERFIEIIGSILHFTVPFARAIFERIVAHEGYFEDRVPTPTQIQVSQFFRQYPFWKSGMGKLNEESETARLILRDMYVDIVMHPDFFYLRERFPSVPQEKIVAYVDEFRAKYRDIVIGVFAHFTESERKGFVLESEIPTLAADVADAVLKLSHVDLRDPEIQDVVVNHFKGKWEAACRGESV